MKSSLLALSLLLSTAAAHAERQLTYTAEMISSGATCQAEAADLSTRFQQATGLVVTGAVCRSQQSFTADGHTYRKDLLGLTYLADREYTPYAAEVDQRDAIYNPFRAKGVGAYATLAECLGDLNFQRDMYAQNTGLMPVLVTCTADVPDNQEEMDIIGPHYTLRIEGFGRDAYVTPAARMYTLATYGLETLPANLRSGVHAMLENQGALLVQEGPGVYVYYRAAGPASINSDVMGYHGTAAECETSKGSLTQMLSRAGSTLNVAWCDGRRLMSLHDGAFSLSEVHRQDATTYATYQACMDDREFVLSDARYANALGAICALDMYEMNKYGMYLYRRGY